MNGKKYAIALAAAILAILTAVQLFPQGQTKRLSAHLDGYQEVPSSISTTGTGEFRGMINPLDTELSYELEYSGLRGDITQAHIHISRPATNGGIAAWLCGTAALPGPPGTPTCPSPGGKVSGVITAADVIGPTGQGVAVGDFEAFLNAIRAGAAYANVHSTMWPGGEIRGAINQPGRP